MLFFIWFCLVFNYTHLHTKILYTHTFTTPGGNWNNPQDRCWCLYSWRQTETQVVNSLQPLALFTPFGNCLYYYRANQIRFYLASDLWLVFSFRKRFLTEIKACICLYKHPFEQPFYHLTLPFTSKGIHHCLSSLL